MFLKWVGTSGALSLATACSPSLAAPPVKLAAAIPKRPLGKTGESVSILGIGGSHLAQAKDEDEAARIVAEAVDNGVNFFDNAWEYHDGRSEIWLGDALVGKRQRVFLMTKVCTHGRGKDVAMTQLETSLKRLRTDHLDLWQVHECIHDDDPELHYAPGGVLEALDLAKRQGKVRFVGFTGHKDPSIHLAMLEKGYAFDTVQMPLNCFDSSFKSFEAQVLPVVNRRRLGAIGMKSLGGTGVAIQHGAITAEEGIRYAMSLPVATTVCGIDSLDVLRQNLRIAAGFSPMTAAEMASLKARCAALAGDGRFELYKTTKKFDAKVGREQHGYPSIEELPL